MNEMYSIARLMLGIYEKALCFPLSWEEKLLLAKGSGYDFLEVNIDGSEERLKRLYGPSSARELNAAISNTGVPALTCALTANRSYPLGERDGSVREKGVEIVKRAVDFALRVGIRLVHIAAYDVVEENGDGVTRAHFYRSMEECLAYASQNCVTLAMETMDTSFMESVANIMACVRYFDSPFLQAYADFGNIAARGLSPEVDISLGGRHVAGIHVKDSTLGVIRDVPYGEGIVDFNSCFAALAQMKYSGVFVAEMWCYDDPAFHPNLKTANDFIRKYMEKY